jgi:xanthine/CO dehydrogenase XdhC/CoxF family maturation factor
VERIEMTSFPEPAEIGAAVKRREPAAVATVISGPGQVGARRVIRAANTANADASWQPRAPRTPSSAQLDRAVDDDVRGIDADEVVVDWPHRFLADANVGARAEICLLTSDPKFKVPLLEVLPRTPAEYMGAIGSRRTHEDPLTQLGVPGLTPEELTRLRSLIGLYGVRTLVDTAMSIAAEVIRLRYGGTGQALTDTDGRLRHTLAFGWRASLAVCTSVARVLLVTGLDRIEGFGTVSMACSVARVPR